MLVAKIAAIVVIGMGLIAWGIVSDLLYEHTTECYMWNSWEEEAEIDARLF